MPYDSSLDENLFSKSWEGTTSTLTVGIFSYNKGAKKLQISRKLSEEPGRSGFAKLGRLTKEELEGILPLLQEAVGQL